MNKWEEYQIEEKIIKILKNAKINKKWKHFGTNSFLTPYQICLEFSKKYPIETKSLAKNLTGKKANKDSLYRYISNQLSIRINSLCFYQ